MKTKRFNVLSIIAMALVMSACCVGCTNASRVVTSDIFPIVYQIGENEFEILPDFISKRAKQVWGYEVVPGVILAKKCGAVQGLSNTEWDNVKHFTEKATINGNKGRLPSKSELEELRSDSLKRRIREMDQFLINQGVEAEKKYYGAVWCSEEFTVDKSYYIDLEDGHISSYYKDVANPGDRVAVAF